jgi:hypothetical protein
MLPHELFDPLLRLQPFPTLALELLREEHPALLAQQLEPVVLIAQ